MVALRAHAQLAIEAAPSRLLGAAAPLRPLPAAGGHRPCRSTAAAIPPSARLLRRHPLVVPRRRPQHPKVLCNAAGSSEGSGSPEGEPPAQVASAGSFLGGGTAANAAMAIAGTALGDRAGLNVSGQLLHGLDSLNPSAAMAYMLPLLAACYAGVAFSDRLEGFAQLRHMFKTALIPQLSILPFWGLGLLALGAGVGEETLFRAFMQQALCGGIADAAPNLPTAATTAAGVAVASVIFGWLHALTPSYFFFATGAGALFGVEYLLYGLPTAAVTHWIYDWIALVFILREWGGSSGSGAAEEAG